MKKIKVFQNESYKKLGDLYGLFFEDINHAADGGLYAELVQNRSFEFCNIDKSDYHSLTAWEKSEDLEWEVSTKAPLNEENIHYLKVETKKNSYIKNLGFNTGIYVEMDKKYDFSFYGKTNAPKSIKIVIEDKEKNKCAESIMIINSTEWKKYKLVLEVQRTTYEGRLVIYFLDEGKYYLDMVSLFPQDTFMGRKNGLRKDIAQALKDMKPKFMRFPGGCLTHDGSLNDHDRNSMYRWRRTLGPIEERPTWRNNWRYNQTLGLGYYEYFCFCEDIGAKPLPVVPAGFNPHKGEGVPIEEIDEWVQETLDLIEFANGGTDTIWGNVRKKMGHEAPFELEYIGIGNEEIGDGFFERYPYFHNAIREKYPNIKIVNTAGPFAVGQGYEEGWKSAKEYGSDLIDEHYYSSPEWFIANMHHYEDYDENGPKVFLGEYASWGNTYYNAIVEAAYMTHLERSKAVALACYAPMLCNVDYVNWKPDMLWFNNHSIMKTPNYYVQKMFMENQGTDAIRFEMEGLDEIEKLYDNENIAGRVSICGNDIKGRIWDVKIKDNISGKITTISEILIEDNKENFLTDIDSSDYVCEFNFKRSEGRKGLKIFFGKTDKDTLLWEFGGWDNWDCNISSIVNGRGSTIAHKIFHVEDIDYSLRLEVKGRHIKTYINGVLYDDTEDKLPLVEELYVTASIDENLNKTIVKVVNLTKYNKTVLLELDGDEKHLADIISLQDCELDAVNSFENPDNIIPVTETAIIDENKLEYTFPSYSVTVIGFI